MTQVQAEWLNAKSSQTVCGLLTDAGHQAFFVGGCVRNALLGVGVSDIDIATDAHPDRVMALSKSKGIKAIPTGIDHGTITLILEGQPFEVTTFRRDMKTDGRHAVVAFSDNIEDDARRRDFTMNALYADAQGQVRDPVGGMPDLAARRLRFIDDPGERIREDYLRILRFFRFHAWYGDPTEGIDADGLAACAEGADGIDGLSKERVGAEMAKLLAAPDPAPSVAAMGQAGILMRVLPGADAHGLAVLVHHEGDLGLKPDPMRRLAVLGGQDVDRNLRLSKAQSRRLEMYRTDVSVGALGYLFDDDGAAVLAVRQAQIGAEIDPKQLELARLGVGKTLPINAGDLMPRLTGAALGAALDDARARWIASGYTLTKDDLLD